MVAADGRLEGGGRNRTLKDAQMPGFVIAAFDDSLMGFVRESKVCED